MSGISTGDEARSGAVTVLVVDDSADQRVLMTKNFERAGCAVTAVGSAEAAIVELDRSTPEVVVVDLVLPGMNGWNLVDRITASHPECVIVVTSVLDPQQYPASAAILPKPFTGAQVRDILGEFVPRWSSLE